MRDALRTCLQIAGGLTEATRRRAVGAARELLDQTGIDVDAVQRSIGERIPPEVQSLADELMASGRANRDLLVGLIREEIDKTMSRVGRLADEVTKVGVVLEALERRIRNLEDGDREPDLADLADEEPDPGLYVPPQPPVEHVPVDGYAAAPAPVARKNAAPGKAPATPEAPATPAAPEAAEAAPAVPVARKNAAPAKASAAKKEAPAARKTAPAKKAAPSKRTATASGGASTAKKTAAAVKSTTAATPGKKTAAAKKATPAKKTAAAKNAAPAKKATPAKKAATAKKTAAPRTQEAKGRD
ncbi:histone [Streptomyces sp. NPDC005722]